jgi:hypothetical protein
MSARVTRVREFRLALIEVEATKIRAAGTGSHEVGAAENATDDIARDYMRALPALAKLERYERRA